ncbi:Tim44 domain-containing protein [Neoehrlichia mikurensis]|uniref:Tim44/TimA family putative adaptor protein n=1 Tax=Neoehrlichia mikurensis TaxID=89586 RepID=UPI001C46003F|nr:Tim44/TimA family putative adaptor protein [Neoehrlichia mikurensis]QXK91683.1 Tim44 domain-containing protein [Neoehrlichia mikurensis]QXK92894.1 Tim44 domain-containing protein [Neoehrlichia mikurensis]QXK93374.1 Tim44 domain-containing protein [Neoehrlichia mikurensis]
MIELAIYAFLAAFIFFRLYNSAGKISTASFHKTNSHYNSNQKEKYIEDIVYEDVTLESIMEGDIENAKHIIETIKKKNKEFTLQNFMNGAANAFELIIKAYNQGKSNILLTLLDGELYNAFVQEIQNRKNLGNVHEDVIVSILSQKIVNVSLINNTAYIVVKFITEQINLIKDINGNLVLKFITEQINLIKDINGNLVSDNVSKINKIF